MRKYRPKETPPPIPPPPVPGVAYVGPRGFRMVLCPLCGRDVDVSSVMDDTRPRYTVHTVSAHSVDWCDNAGELLPRKPS